MPTNKHSAPATVEPMVANGHEPERIPPMLFVRVDPTLYRALARAAREDVRKPVDYVRSVLIRHLRETGYLND